MGLNSYRIHNLPGDQGAVIHSFPEGFNGLQGFCGNCPFNNVKGANGQPICTKEITRIEYNTAEGQKKGLVYWIDGLLLRTSQILESSELGRIISVKMNRKTGVGREFADVTSPPVSILAELAICTNSPKEKMQIGTREINQSSPDDGIQPWQSRKDLE